MSTWMAVKSGSTEYEVTGWLQAEMTTAINRWPAGKPVVVKVSKFNGVTTVLVFDGVTATTMTIDQAKAHLRTKRDVAGKPVALAGAELAALERKYDRLMWS